MKDVLKDNVWNILVLCVSLIGMYFTVQSNTKEIELLKLEIVELELCNGFKRAISGI